MTVQECYANMQGNYEEVLGRLGSDKLISKYLKRFQEDESFGELCTALEAGEYKQAFEHAHNLKGVGMNLAFTALYQSAGELCESLRGGEPTGDVEALLAQTKEDYHKVILAIQQL